MSAKKHHFLPVFYLAGFTPSGRRDDFLAAIDLQEGTCRPAKPNTTGYVGHLYRGKYVDASPDFVEKELSKLDDEFAKALDRVIEAGGFPDEDTRAWLINFVALQMTRVPRAREPMERAIDQSGKMLLREVFSSKESYRRLIDKMGSEAKGMPDFATMREYANSGAYDVVASNEQFNAWMLKGAEAALEGLWYRTWHFVRFPAGTLCLGDDPVIRAWSLDNPPPFRPGVNLLHSYIIVPLSKSLAMIGLWDNDPYSLMREKVLSDELANNFQMRQAKRWIYGKDCDFPILVDIGKVPISQVLRNPPMGRK